MGCSGKGSKVVTPAAFDTITVECDAAAVLARALAGGANLRKLSDTHVAVALDETTTTRADIEALWGWFAPRHTLQIADYAAGIESLIPPALRRTSPPHPPGVFNTHHSETEMLRYLRSLPTRTWRWTAGMIPLGSCTMKLNATSRDDSPSPGPSSPTSTPLPRMISLRATTRSMNSLPVAVRVHRLSAGISLQPNAGSQGEYAGLWPSRPGTSLAARRAAMSA